MWTSGEGLNLPWPQPPRFGRFWLFTASIASCSGLVSTLLSAYRAFDQVTLTSAFGRGSARRVEWNDRFRRRIQPVDATHSLNISAGVWKPSVLRGLSFNCLAIALSWVWEKSERSMPFGMY